ncbi:unnamed protein product [Staurois parvus]|uniref:Olfactory receptor n=1 Tax=Staurois parvus TaxID=386267 RepID=A0ABN9AXC8_9NEOB|nr:unnamed protein product [Staurois parvus]
MLQRNYSVTEFYLIGFQNLKSFKILLFLLLLITYIMAISGNLLIVVLVSTSQRLQSPMFYFLKHLSISEILFTTNITPNMLHVLLRNSSTMSLTGCIVQFYVYIASGSTECYLLAAMSYDRYLAICKPLLYNKIMGQKLQNSLVIFCWLLGFLSTLITMGILTQLKFCGNYIIDHYFCDLAPFVDLACSDTSVLQIIIIIFSFPIMIIPFFLVLVSYSCVVVAILGMSSVIGRKKAFFTCSSHLSVVTMFYGSLIIIYLVPSNSKTLNKMISVLYTVVTPLFNPLIYSIRNQEIRAAIYSFISKYKNLTIMPCK